MADLDDQNINNNDVEEVVDQPDKLEPETPEVQEEPQEPSQETQEQEEVPQNEEPEPKMSRRAEKRYEELKIRGLISSLKQQSQPQIQPQAPDYSEQIEADPEVLQHLQSEAQQYGEQQYNHGIEQAKAIQFETRLEIDTPKVLNKYPQLNPSDQEKFNPGVADAINVMYLNTVGYDHNTGMVQNPNVRYADYVESFMELAESIAGDKIKSSTKNIAQQSAMTGLRPDGSATKLNLNKAPEDMSIEELQAITGMKTRLKK